MKTEVSSFIPSGSIDTIILSDPTMVVKSIIFFVSKSDNNYSYSSYGFSDSIKNRAQTIVSGSSNNICRQSTSSCITHYEIVGGSPTVKLAGNIPSTGFSTPGEFTVNFTVQLDNPVVSFIAFGD